MTATADHTVLPRWELTDVHPSLDARSFRDALERTATEADRLVALFDEHDIRATTPRTPTALDGTAADRAIAAFNRTADDVELLRAYVYAIVSTDSRDAAAQSRLGEVTAVGATLRPLVARLADWVDALGVVALAELSTEVREHVGPLTRLVERARHQMSEAEEHLYAELAVTGSAAWARLQQDVTSQATTTVELPDGSAHLPLPAVRGLATSADPVVRRAAYTAELAAWPRIEVPVAAAMHAIKAEANSVNRRRNWATPLDASLFANGVGRPTFDAMHAAVLAALPDFRAWMRTKARLLGHRDALPWWDLVAPLPVAAADVSWVEGLGTVRDAFGTYSPNLGALVDRAIAERWVDAEPRDGKGGGAFCLPFGADRSRVLLNWAGSADSVQTMAHEFGHAYHNTTLAGRTNLQRRLPMALAETASIFCETIVVETGLSRASGDERLALLDVDLSGSNQIVVDIHSRFLFETAVFERCRRGRPSPAELCSMMRDAQLEAYGDGLDQTTAHPYMWLVKPHYYGAHYYNWPYTYGLLFGLGLHARYVADPERFRAGYDTLLSRAGMDTAEELGAAFGLDVTDEAFWTASLDVVRSRMAGYAELARPHLTSATRGDN